MTPYSTKEEWPLVLKSSPCDSPDNFGPATKPQFPHLEREDNNPNLINLFKDKMNIMLSKIAL